MKKLFFSLVAATMATTATFAQSSMLATLSHEGEISAYYGVSALRDAHAAAAHGDIITLSSGSFNAVDITKAVTIRGAGMAIDNTAMTEPTVLIGDFNISIPEDATGRLTLEGIYHNHTIRLTTTLKNATFLKDRFRTIQSNTNDGVCRAINLTMIHCRVAGEMRMYNDNSIACTNCIINCPAGVNGNVLYDFQNCVLMRTGNDDFDEFMNSSSFKNSILIQDGSWALKSSNTVYNCVGIKEGIFQAIQNSSNVYKSYEEVFKTYTGTYSDTESFELTDDAKNTLKGLDGTEVGIYGGNIPFSTTPTNPQITKCNVAAKSTADGKLSVDITVQGAE